MSDVLFDTAKYTLKPGAREKLAKVSGLLLAYPGLRLEVEGHTDSVGNEEYNQSLSEKRALSVRDFLVLQGISASAIDGRGFGESRPIASNDTAEGRQQNRRVEMVVSGEVIGVKLSSRSVP
ncbi:MAG: OmpA family protein, partial [Acidobacteria bacterium]|nr:OmpA family protein [Acidobacteriota bacterium]